MAQTVEHYMCHYDNLSGVTAGDACRMLNESNWVFLILDLKRWNDVLYLCIHKHSDSELSYLFTDLFNLMILSWKCSRLFEGTLLVLNAWKTIQWLLHIKLCFGNWTKSLFRFEIHFNIRHKWGAVKVQGGDLMCANRKRPKQKINSNNNNKAY